MRAVDQQVGHKFMDDSIIIKLRLDGGSGSPDPVSPVIVDSPITPEVYQTLEDWLAHQEFEIEIPRQCMEARIIKEKLDKVPPAQRAQTLRQLMDEHHLQRIILINASEPVNATYTQAGTLTRNKKT